MTRKRLDGYVVAMTVDDPADPGRRCTLYWHGPDQPHVWSGDQRCAARFVDAALAIHTLAVLAPPHPSKTVRAEPALAARNGGARTPIIAGEPPTFDRQRHGGDSGESVQESLFGDVP